MYWTSFGIFIFLKRRRNGFIENVSCREMVARTGGLILWTRKSVSIMFEVFWDPIQQKDIQRYWIWTRIWFLEEHRKKSEGVGDWNAESGRPSKITILLLPSWSNSSHLGDETFQFPRSRKEDRSKQHSMIQFPQQQFQQSVGSVFWRICIMPKYEEKLEKMPRCDRTRAADYKSSWVVLIVIEGQEWRSWKGLLFTISIGSQQKAE